MITNRQLFLNNVAQTTSTPLALEILKAEGIYLYSETGKKYIDLISGIGVSNAGHRHPKVIEAIHKQLDNYMHLMVYGEYIQTPQVKLAEALASTLPEELNNVYFVNSGTEAVEGALKLAKRYTGRSKIVACKKAYHGSTQGSLSVMGEEWLKQAYRPLLPGVTFIEYGSVGDLSYITGDTACIIIESVQGEAGVITADPEYFNRLKQKCTETGTLLIMDEIQTGFGRTGKFWCFEHYGIEPDILLTAKGMGGGLPLGAFISSKKIMRALAENPILGHITTFGGNPVSCAASLATLNVIRDEKLVQQVEEKAFRFKKNLVHPLIKEFRNMGLMIGLEFESFQVLKPIIDRAIENGVVTDWFLFNDRSMRIAPPLTIRFEEIDDACQKILKAISGE
jgi:putrescine aminotransferase